MNSTGIKEKYNNRVLNTRGKKRKGKETFWRKETTVG